MYLSPISVWRPDEVLSNADLARMVDTSDEWIFKHVGIRERRRSPRDLQVHQQGAKAGRLALAGVDRASIDLVLCGLSIADFEIPATANLIAAELELFTAAAFDLRAACCSFLFALHTLRALIDSGAHKRALLVVPETYTQVTDYSDRSTSVLWGDASIACIASAEKPAGFCYQVEDTRIGSRSKDWQLIQIRKGGFFQQNGPAVHRFAIRTMTSVVEEQLAARGLEAAAVPWFVGHQANMGVLEGVRDRVGFAPSQMISNIEQFGNTGAAGVPSVLADHQESFKHGDRIVAAAVGAGLSWGSALLRAERS